MNANSSTQGGQTPSGGAAINSIATYTCVFGYILAGSATRVCQGDSIWSGSSPSCEGTYAISIKEVLYPADFSDFQLLSNQILTIPLTTPVGSSVCQHIAIIIGDNVDEVNESFTITASVISPNAITLPASTSVTIVDDDSKCP